jgi:hypothetical protein
MPTVFSFFSLTAASTAGMAAKAAVAIVPTARRPSCLERISSIPSAVATAANGSSGSK